MRRRRRRQPRGASSRSRGISGCSGARRPLHAGCMNGDKVGGREARRQQQRGSSRGRRCGRLCVGGCQWLWRRWQRRRREARSRRRLKRRGRITRRRGGRERSVDPGEDGCAAAAALGRCLPSTWRRGRRQRRCGRRRRDTRRTGRRWRQRQRWRRSRRRLDKGRLLLQRCSFAGRWVLHRWLQVRLFVAEGGASSACCSRHAAAAAGRRRCVDAQVRRRDIHRCYGGPGGGLRRRRSGCIGWPVVG